MEVNLVLGLAAAGTTLGVVEGLKPGPLLTMVIRETLSGGFRAGAWTAAAPIFSDGPLVVLSLFAAAWNAFTSTQRSSEQSNRLGPPHRFSEALRPIY